MKEHKFNGSFEYTPDYSCDEDDFAGVSEIFTDVIFISPVADMQLGEEEAVLLKVNQNQDIKACLVLNAKDGKKYFLVPTDPVPTNKEDFASSMKFWTVGTGDDDKIALRSNIWKDVHRLSSRREEVANYVIE